MNGRGYIFTAIFLSCLWCSLLPAFAGSTLEDQGSPYLAMHAGDPVDWQPWGQSALDRAVKLGRPLLISSGYFSCHWCHVMHRESFSDAEVATWLNEHFVAVKLDREQHAAVDDYLLDFTRQMKGHAGWPLNVFLTPQGYPFHAEVYLSREALLSKLERIADMWQQQSGRLTQLARDATAFQLESRAPLMPVEVQSSHLQQALRQAVYSNGDTLQGGLGQQSRFPRAPLMMALLDNTPQDAGLNEWLRLTLGQMQNRGLRDHVHGGFFRYTVDPGWSEPHFEKMLYTQALMVRLFLRAAVVFDEPAYADVARDTLDFVLRDMRSEQGGFVSSLSALNRDGEDGEAYLWRSQALQDILTQHELQVVARHWGMQISPEQTEPRLPMLAGNPIDDTDSTLLAQAQRKMRAQRVNDIPADTKVITAWNALLLSALVEAAEQLQDDRYADAAETLKRFLLERAWDGRQLRRQPEQEKPMLPGELDDYAYMAQALRDYAIWQQSPDDAGLGDLFAAKAWLNFYRQRLWLSADTSLLPGMQGQVAWSDRELPAADAVLLRLGLNGTHEVLAQKARQAAGYMFREVSEDALQYASHLGWVSRY